MSSNKDENKNKSAAYFLFLGIVSILSGLANTKFLLNPDNVFDIILGVIGVGAILASIILFREYKRLS
ncbi:hypothetical protein [Oceanobacillus halotolerans]|uniref:hypothetical protein n=1 Tax=Oceanobacillus halotolerans TaxID=2663380 RepID=UPI0013D9A277|nr:hypothetical protein [Oceanobacillus halotolerans]